MNVFTSHHWLLSSLLIVFAGCASETETTDGCEPCAAGYVCMWTPFETQDCVPARSSAQFDGGTGQRELDAGFVGSSPDSGVSSNFSDGGILTGADFGGTDMMNLQANQDQFAAPDVNLQPPPMDSPPLPMLRDGQVVSRITQLDVPTGALAARMAGCRVVGRNAGSGLSGVFTILGTTLSEQLQERNSGAIPLVLLSRFLDWAPGMTANDYAGGPLEIYLGAQGSDGRFLIDEQSFEPGSNPRRSRMHFQSLFSGAVFETETGQFTLEPTGFAIPLIVELDLASLSGRVEIDESGLALRNTILSGYLSFSSVRRIVMAIQEYCNAAPSDSFCAAANRFLDGDPSTPELDGDTAEIARDVILPLMRNLDARVDGDGAVACDPFCREADCVECNSVSVCAILESVPVELESR